MIRFKIKERMADKEFKDGKRLTIAQVAEATGINRMTISKMINQKGYSTATDTLDKLCTYFECEIQELAEYIKEIEQE